MPSAEVIKKALAAIQQDEADRIYFFETLTSPDWIKPLSDAGIFQSPPPLLRDGEYVQFPLWAESRYLARMAQIAPETVLEIVLAIPETENVRIHEDFLDAALTMPAHLAVKLVPKFMVWVKLPYHLLLSEKLGDLVSYLALNGEVDSALHLAEALFARLTESITTSASRRYSDIWQYQEILKKYVPHLLAIAALPTLNLLCDLLVTALKDTKDSNGEGEDTTDQSYIWRPAIEEQGSMQLHGQLELRGLLTSTLRDAAMEVVRLRQVSLSEIVEYLERFRESIFHRLAIYLLSLFPEVSPELVVEHLTDRRQFDDLNVLHEYTLLARAGFRYLSQKDQKKILGWIDRGPTNVERVKEIYKERTEHPASNELVTAYINGWRRDWLARIGSELPAKWKDRYEKLVAEIGPAEHPEFAWYPGQDTTWGGPTSPKSIDELDAMSVGDLVTFLQTWQPPLPEDFMGTLPSRDGLKNALISIVESDPNRFATQAELFREIDPVYISAILTGFERAAEQKRLHFSPTVLDLCDWIIHQGSSMRGEASREGIPHWAWSRKTIAHLLSSGLASDEQAIPFELREKIWEIIKLLTEDPDPTPEDEERYGGSNMEPFTLAINTVRGEAMHAAIRYAIWVRRYMEQETKDQERIAPGFDQMPEVRDVLHRHLDPSDDPSPAIRSVYGQWFPWLVMLDQEWVIQSIPKIFPIEASQYNLRDAAWEAYIIFCNPYNNVYDILSEEYYRAVGRIDITSGKRRRYDPEKRLAEHLMRFYWSGKIGLDEPDGLIALYFARAPDALRGYALEFVGRSLYNTTEKVPSELLARLQALWGWRMNFMHGETQDASHTTELAAFGWWFGSGKFEDAWAIAQLELVLSRNEKVEANHLVIEHLDSLITSMPLSVVRCLTMLIKGDEQGWVTSSILNQVRGILAKALQSGDNTAQQDAENIVRYLVTRGDLHALDLLEKSQHLTE
jgi:hypothetical protein